jgi:hypothetical protein
MNTEDYEDLQALAKDIYFDIKKFEETTGMRMTEGERCEEVAKTMEKVFKERDPNFDWEVTVTYESMMEFFKLHNTKRI